MPGLARRAARKRSLLPEAGPDSQRSGEWLPSPLAAGRTGSSDSGRQRSLSFLAGGRRRCAPPGPAPPPPRARVAPRRPTAGPDLTRSGSLRAASVFPDMQTHRGLVAALAAVCTRLDVPVPPFLQVPAPDVLPRQVRSRAGPELSTSSTMAPIPLGTSGRPPGPRAGPPRVCDTFLSDRVAGPA
jgi:hypothetical protein